jgi:sugar lactone lactonase YvrE
MALDDRRGQERLWRLEHDGQVTVLDEDLTLSNGLGWSPGGSVLYSTDTAAGRVWARDYDPVTGDVGERRPLLDLGEEAPDGLSVDSEGNLWVAVYSAGEVRCHAPGGELLEVVEVGALPATSCAFVGPTLRTLLVTTASEDQDDPDAGKLFTAEVGVAGRPTTAWTPVEDR